MEAWAKEAIDLWQTHRLDIVRAFHDGAAQNPHLPPDDPVKNYSVEDTIQMVDGAGAMIAEDLEGRGTDIKDTYMNAVIPGILSQGQSLATLVGVVTMNAVLAYNLIVPKASPEHRDQIARFYVNWYVKFNLDMVKVGLEAGAAT
jgi:hypothetical protein